MAALMKQLFASLHPVLKMTMEEGKYLGKGLDNADILLTLLRLSVIECISGIMEDTKAKTKAIRITISLTFLMHRIQHEKLSFFKKEKYYYRTPTVCNTQLHPTIRTSPTPTLQRMQTDVVILSSAAFCISSFIF
jgi:hypothetical protein